MKISAFSYTNRGGRDHNEDSVRCRIEGQRGVFVVADGLGGHQCGEVASALAADTLLDGCLQAETVDADALTTLFRDANAKILEQQSQPGQEGMKTTAALLCLEDDRVLRAHIGDSRVYALYDDGFSCVTQDHSYIADLLRKGSITAEEAKVHPARNMLTNALGVWDRIRIDIDRLKEDYQALLVCSDGLHGYVSEDTIRMVLSEDGHTAEEKARLLVQLANDMGGYDNVTVVVVQKEADEVDG